MESWRTIEGHENYMVSSHGRVKSVARSIKHKDGKVTNHEERILKTQITKKGYERVGLSSNTKNGYKTSQQVHRLVAKAFVPNPKNKPQVNHKDTNKRNNHFTNLEWVTNLENHEHKLENNLVPETHKPKRVGKFDEKGNLLEEFDSIYSAAKSVDAKQWMVSRVVNGERKTFKGFSWRYI